MRKEYTTKLFRVTYTLEEEGPHLTIPYDHYNDVYVIAVFFQGGGVCNMEGTPHALEPGTIMVLPSEDIRCFRFRQNGCHERISLYFTGSILSGLADAMPVWSLFAPHSQKRYTPEHYDPNTVQPLLEKLRELLLREDPLKEAKIHLLILELMFALFDAGQVDERSVQNEQIGEICRYIRSHLTQELSYESLQERFLVSRYQLTEVFRRSTGMPLTEYIIHKRLTEAASRIREGMPIEQAAEQAGFCTYSHFYKAFKKRYGVSPRQYSKNTLGK